MSKCFWSYNCRRITTVQQHETLQLIVASQVDQLCQHVVAHSSPICPHQQTTVAKYPFHGSRGDRQTEDLLAMDAAVWTRHCPKSQDQDRDRDSRDPRPRPRPRLRFQDQDRDRDSRVPRPRPRPRLVKTSLEMSRELQVWLVITTGSLIHCDCDGSLQHWWKLNTCSTVSNVYLFYLSFAGAGLGLKRAGLNKATAGLVYNDD